MVKVTLEAPWYTFQKKVKALFEQDPDIVVGDIYEPDNGKLNYAFDIEVSKHAKFVILDKLLPRIKNYGNVNLGIVLYDEEDATDAMSGLDMYKILFEGNHIVKDIKELTDPMGMKHGYVRFWPEVVQFYDDDISDYSGNWNGLAADIAWEVFENDTSGVNFCTADKREDTEK